MMSISEILAKLMTVKIANNISFFAVNTLKYLYTVIDSFSLKKHSVYTREKFLNCEHPIY